jgi:hypothetical protein
MTHEELLADIDRKILLSEHTIYPVFMQALRAVVELHYPSGIFCSGCGFDEEYNEPAQLLPCPTIQAIESALQ